MIVNNVEATDSMYLTCCRGRSQSTHLTFEELICHQYIFSVLDLLTAKASSKVTSMETYITLSAYIQNNEAKDFVDL